MDFQPSTLSLKRSLLEAVCDVYEEVCSRFPHVCARECSACCTCNVVATTLEVLSVIEEMERINKSQILTGFVHESAGNRLRPRLTINELAQYCLEGKEPPEGDSEYGSLPCPLREHDGCPVYHVRPFSCRSMWSSELCSHGGHAVMNPVLISMNGVFEQIIEHLDHGGLVGNMLDLLTELSDPGFRSSYRNSAALEPSLSLRQAQRNPGFVVMREHRKDISAALSLLWQREVDGIPFREALAALQGDPGKPGASPEAE